MLQSPYLDEAIKRLLAAVGKLPAPLRKPKQTMLIKGNMRDDRTFAQLAEQKFSGIRANDLWLRFEIWILGRLDSTLSYSEFFRNPRSLNDLYAKVFHIEAVFSPGAQRDIQKLEERKLMLSDTDIQKALQAREDNERKEKKHG